MFTSTAYEAFYSYIGLYLHQASIEVITSKQVLIGILLLILGFSFISGTWKYFAKYLPSMFGARGSAGIGIYFRILACFIVGVSLLKVETKESVLDHNRRPWSSNPYVYSKFPGIEQNYEVSFVFSLLTRSAEEISKFAHEVVDHLFKQSNSQLEAPDAFYKAVMFAGAQSIDDPQLSSMVSVYTNNCLDHILPLLAQAKSTHRVDEFFKEYGQVDRELQLIPITIEDGTPSNCLDFKQEMRRQLQKFAAAKGARFSKYYHGKIFVKKVELDDIQKNLIASSVLVNYFLDKKQDNLGTSSGAKVEGAMANFLVGWNKFWSFDGFLNLIGQDDQVGAALTAKRATQFSEYLQRAPHLKGMVKLFLIAIFPWLVFFVVAGKWKIIISWFFVYISVLLWTPIWTLLYHLMTSIALSTDLLSEFGKINDGVSLYASSLINAKIYQFYAIYSWLQLLVGPLPTLVLGYGLFSSVLRDSEVEQAPTVVTAAKDVGISAATGGTSAAAGTIVRKI